MFIEIILNQKGGDKPIEVITTLDDESNFRINEILKGETGGDLKWKQF